MKNLVYLYLDMYILSQKPLSPPVHDAPNSSKHTLPPPYLKSCDPPPHFPSRSKRKKQETMIAQ